jgi:hypothetical protein
MLIEARLSPSVVSRDRITLKRVGPPEILTPADLPRRKTNENQELV